MISGKEGPSLSFFWILALLFTAASQISDGTTQTLFLSHVGAAQLPLMFTLKAGLDLLLAALYVPLASRLGHHRTLTVILSAAGLGMLLLYFLTGTDRTFSYSALYLFNEGILTLLKIHWGVYLLDHFTVDHAARALPIIYTGARVGAVMGGLMMSPLAKPLGPRTLLLLSSIIYFSAVLYSRFRKTPPPPLDQRRLQIQARELAAARITHLRRGVSIGWHSPLLRSIALATVLMVLSRYGLRYLYSECFAVTFTETELASFWGLYLAIANGATILLQATLLGRMLAYWGISAINLAYAIAVAGTFLLLGLWPGLALAITARFVESELKATVKTPLSLLFYGAIPLADRAAGRAFILGLVVPLSTILASLALQATLRSSSLIYWGLGCACCFILASHCQNRAFATA